MSDVIVLVDLDGPVAAFDRQFFTRCADQGWEVDCTPDTQIHRYATDHVVDPATRRLARAMVNEPGWFAVLPPVDGAVDGLHRLAERAEVWLCTKPLEANPTCRDDKGRWVAEHIGREWERRLIITPDKSMVRGDVLLDDAPFPEWYDNATWTPVIYPTPWNRCGSKWEDVPSWRWDDPVEDLLAHRKSTCDA